MVGMNVLMPVRELMMAYGKSGIGICACIRIETVGRL